MTDRELMQMVLRVFDWLESRTIYQDGEIKETHKALRDRLAQPEQEPVAWHEPGAYGNVTTHKDWALANGWEPLYKERI